MDRFTEKNETVIDTQTGLMWTRDAAPLEFPLRWDEALQAVQEMNQSNRCGYRDWKLPNRRELFSLVSHETINPCLPAGHPFMNVFTGYYWTSSSCTRLPDQAWYIHLGGARVFKGMKYGSYMVWPVRICQNHSSNKVFQTGQQNCYDGKGAIIDCAGTGQDGGFQSGQPYTKNRFVENTHTVYDSATDLTWLRNANANGAPMDWESAFESISQMNREKSYGYDDWRLPGIIELESLADLGRHSPALPTDHLFHGIQNFYWSATTSAYDTDYAWVFYSIDGIIGVGYKSLPEFYVWPVR